MYIVILFFTAWVDACQSTIVYERREFAQVLYVIPVSTILGRLPVAVFLWAIPERSSSRSEGNELNFRAQVVIRHRAAVTDVRGGM
jgi:hypothetical protein